MLRNKYTTKSTDRILSANTWKCYFQRRREKRGTYEKPWEPSEPLQQQKTDESDSDEIETIKAVHETRNNNLKQQQHHQNISQQYKDAPHLSSTVTP